MVGGFWFPPSPASVLIYFANCVAQSPTTADRTAELHGELAKNRFGFQVPARASNYVFQDFGNRKVLHQRYDVGERFVKREHVGVRSFIELFVHAVEHRVSRFMRDEIVRQTGVHSAAGN